MFLKMVDDMTMTLTDTVEDIPEVGETTGRKNMRRPP